MKRNIIPQKIPIKDVHTHTKFDMQRRLERCIKLSELVKDYFVENCNVMFDKLDFGSVLPGVSDELCRRITEELDLSYAYQRQSKCVSLNSKILTITCFNIDAILGLEFINESIKTVIIDLIEDWVIEDYRIYDDALKKISSMLSRTITYIENLVFIFCNSTLDKASFYGTLVKFMMDMKEIKINRIGIHVLTNPFGLNVPEARFVDGHETSPITRSRIVDFIGCLPEEISSLNFSLLNNVTVFYEVVPNLRKFQDIRLLNLHGLLNKCDETFREDSIANLARSLPVLLELDLSVDLNSEVASFNQFLFNIMQNLLDTIMANLTTIQFLDLSGIRSIDSGAILKLLRMETSLWLLRYAFGNRVFSTLPERESYSSVIVMDCGSVDGTVDCMERYLYYISYWKSFAIEFSSMAQSYFHMMEVIFPLFYKVIKLYVNCLQIILPCWNGLNFLIWQRSYGGCNYESLLNLANMAIECMENHVSQVEVSQQCLLFLHSEVIKENIAYDYLRFVRIAIYSMGEGYFNNNPDFLSYLLDHIATLPDKVELEELAKLANYDTIAIMLKILEKQLNERLYTDRVMGTILLILWNITDECAVSCEKIHSLNGTELLISIMDSYKDNYPVIGKLVGLVSNMVEVPHMRIHYFSQNIVQLLTYILDRDNVYSAYFVTSVLANLGVEWKNQGFSPDFDMENCMKRLVSCVDWWKERLKTRIVSYRSFNTLIPLVCEPDIPSVQYWAVWAIMHVSRLDISKYIPYLRDSKFIEIINNYALTHDWQGIQSCARSILDMSYSST